MILLGRAFVLQAPLGLTIRIVPPNVQLPTAIVCAKILRVYGFDSVRILCSMGGIFEMWAACRKSGPKDPSLSMKDVGFRNGRTSRLGRTVNP